MFIYAGIDEAGYGPLFGPLVIGRAVLAVPNLNSAAAPPQLWQRLSKAVGKNLSGRKGRIVVNDSKKLTTKASGIKHLELGCLAFAHLVSQGGNIEQESSSKLIEEASGFSGNTLDSWLDFLGESCHHDLSNLPWYAPSAQRPWQEIPSAISAGELTVARAMLRRTCRRIGVQVMDMGGAVVLEDQFNQMVVKSRSKASTSFTFVAGHILKIWQEFGHLGPTVVVDRQGGRTHYLRLIKDIFPEAELKILNETDHLSAYRIIEKQRSMTLHFQVAADGAHLPTALASMVSKYTRELLMSRFKSYFADLFPDIKPTAGYGQDAKRFWEQVHPRLSRHSIKPDQLRRRA